MSSVAEIKATQVCAHILVPAYMQCVDESATKPWYSRITGKSCGQTLKTQFETCVKITEQYTNKFEVPAAPSS
jgi:hypothetical protein